MEEPGLGQIARTNQHRLDGTGASATPRALRHDRPDLEVCLTTGAVISALLVPREDLHLAAAQEPDCRVAVHVRHLSEVVPPHVPDEQGDRPVAGPFSQPGDAGDTGVPHRHEQLAARIVPKEALDQRRRRTTVRTWPAHDAGDQPEQSRTKRGEPRVWRGQRSRLPAAVALRGPRRGSTRRRRLPRPLEPSASPHPDRTVGQQRRPRPDLSRQTTGNLRRRPSPQRPRWAQCRRDDNLDGIRSESAVPKQRGT